MPFGIVSRAFAAVVRCVASLGASVVLIHRRRVAGVVTRPSRFADSVAVLRRRPLQSSQAYSSRCSARFASDEAIPAA